jgi:TPR repeat protein
MRWLQSGLFRRFMMAIGTLALLPIAFLAHEIVKLSALLEEPAAPRRAPPADFAARTDPRRACDAGDGKACDYLGWMHAEGQGAAKDDARAIVLFGKACDLGVGRACGELGDRYAKGRGVRKDLAKAVEPYRKGCELKEGWACQCLGFLHASGWGTPKNPARAVQLYWEACGLGDVMGCQLLGWTYASGEGVPKDGAKAAKAYRIACDKGDGFSCNGLGVLYGTGQGLAKDEARAFQLYRKACELNDGSGCVSLGVAFVDGRGVKKDEKRGLELYRKACDIGNGHGCGSLGWMYTHGVGTAKDEVRAAEFYRQGCDKGDRDACGVPGREEPAAPSVPRCQAADMEPPPESAKGFRRRTLAPANPGFQVSVGAESPCGRATKPWVYQLEVEDLAGAKTSLSRAFESARAAPLPKGCQIEAQWLPGMDKLADNYSETRWVHRANLDRFEREVLALGTLQVSLDAFAGREDDFMQPYGIPESELLEYERLLAEERAEAASADPLKRRMRGDRIRDLQPRAELVRCTRHSELTQVQLVLPLRHARRGLDLRTTRATVAPTVTRRPFSYGGAEEARRAMERFK